MDNMIFNTSKFHKIRKKHDLKYEEIANVCGCTTQNIGLIAKGKHQPPSDLLYRIVNLFNENGECIRMEDLLTEKGCADVAETDTSCDYDDELELLPDEMLLEEIDDEEGLSSLYLQVSHYSPLMESPQTTCFSVIECDDVIDSMSIVGGVKHTIRDNSIESSIISEYDIIKYLLIDKSFKKIASEPFLNLYSFEYLKLQDLFSEWAGTIIKCNAPFDTEKEKPKVPLELSSKILWGFSNRAREALIPFFSGYSHHLFIYLFNCLKAPV